MSAKPKAMGKKPGGLSDRASDIVLDFAEELDETDPRRGSHLDPAHHGDADAGGADGRAEKCRRRGSGGL